MKHIKVILKDDSIYEVNATREPVHTRYEGVFVIVVDTYGHEVAFPAADVKRIDSTPEARGW